MPAPELIASRVSVTSSQPVDNAAAQLTERELLKRAQQGDHGAFAHIVRSYQRPVYNLCHRMLGNPEEAEDATQETFIRAYANLNKYDSNRKFVNWVLTIASNHCIDRLRKRRIHWTSLEDVPYVERIPMPEAVNPHQIAEQRERADEVQYWIDQLPPDYRTPLVLLYWYGYSYEEIAEAMNLSVPAVKSRLHRARKRIADMMRQTAASTRTPAPSPTSAS
ncbi:MAG TPA: sigma-70 family RNA polymerase sigma factor [Anaerolineae bacterium]|nr:sigma-70 family RNA polymerase sigma factor [Anaerolineae bacterium]